MRYIIYIHTRYYGVCLILIDKNYISYITAMPHSLRISVHRRNLQSVGNYSSFHYVKVAGLLLMHEPYLQQSDAIIYIAPG